MTNLLQSGIREITGKDPGDMGNDGLLFTLLREGIAALLNEPGERLFQILYRLDVPEPKVQAVISTCMAEQWPDELAKLIMEREKERQFWRQRYRNDSSSNPATEDQPEKGSQENNCKHNSR